jgi:hypothetical protein
MLSKTWIIGIFVGILLISLSSSFDEDTQFVCGGDDEMVLSCLGEEELSKIGGMPLGVEEEEPTLPGGGGGGSTPSEIAESLGIGEISGVMCNLTYEYLISHGLEYSEIYNIINEYEEETGETTSWTTVRSYLDNWQGLCSDKIKRTLEPKFVCEGVYYFVLENGINPTSGQFQDLSDDMNQRVIVSDELLAHYFDNHYSLCYLEGYSDKFPGKPLTVLNIFLTEPLVECSENVSGLLGISIPTFRINIGEIECKTIENLRWLFKMNRRLEGYED